MKNLYFLNEEERNRILNLHQVATENQYLMEQLVVSLNGDVNENTNQYWGVSEDCNTLFTSENIIVIEGNEMRRLEYNIDSIPYILNVAKNGFNSLLRESKISLTESLSIPKKFLKGILESLEIDSKFKKNILNEWDEKFYSTFNILTENTDIFVTENLLESLWTEVGIITEITWKEWRKQVGSRISKGFGKIMSGISSVAKATIGPILQKGIIPFVRWIRRNLQSYYGIIVEVIASMFPTVVVVKVINVLIILLDMYEILFDDFDPYDKARADMPFIYLIGDIVSLLFSGAVGKSTTLGLKAATKTGLKSGVLRTTMEELLTKLPGLKKWFDWLKGQLGKVFGQNALNIVTPVFNGLDSFITKITTWIKKMLGSVASTAGEIATKQGLKKLATGAAMGTAFAWFFTENSLSPGAKGENVKKLQQALNIINQRMPESCNKVQVTGFFDDNTKNSLIKLQKYINSLGSDFKELEDGVLRPNIAAFLSKVSNIEIDLGLSKLGFFKTPEFIKQPLDYSKTSFGNAMMETNKWLNTTLSGLRGSLSNK